MLRTRLLTAAVLLPAVGALIVFAPDWLFTIFIATAASWGLYEVAAMTGALHMVAIPLFAVVGGAPDRDAVSSQCLLTRRGMRANLPRPANDGLGRA